MKGTSRLCDASSQRVSRGGRLTDGTLSKYSLESAGNYTPYVIRGFM